MKLHRVHIIAILSTACWFIALPAVGAIKFVLPIGGTPYSDWTIVNYVDRDPTGGIRDYRDGTYSYDGHRGIDFTLPNFAAMDRGVSVLAAADGTVWQVHDGEFDRYSRVNPGTDNPNFVDVYHGNGLLTRYLHLYKNSITVVPGQSVTAGQKIGLVGSSGLSTDAHLHFEVRQSGQVVDTQIDSSSPLFINVPYAGDRKGTLDHGITNFLPSTADLVERPVDVRTFTQATGQLAYLWTNLYGTKPGDVLDFKWYKPSGELYRNLYWYAPEIHYGWWFAGIGLPTTPDVGEWRVVFSIDGTTMITDRFRVGVPEPASCVLMLAALSVIVTSRYRVSRAPARVASSQPFHRPGNPAGYELNRDEMVFQEGLEKLDLTTVIGGTGHIEPFGMARYLIGSLQFFELFHRRQHAGWVYPQPAIFANREINHQHGFGRATLGQAERWICTQEDIRVNE